MKSKKQLFEERQRILEMKLASDLGVDLKEWGTDKPSMLKSLYNDIISGKAQLGMSDGKAIIVSHWILINVYPNDRRFKLVEGRRSQPSRSENGQSGSNFSIKRQIRANQVPREMAQMILKGILKRRRHVIHSHGSRDPVVGNMTLPGVFPICFEHVFKCLVVEPDYQRTYTEKLSREPNKFYHWVPNHKGMIHRIKIVRLW